MVWQERIHWVVVRVLVVVVDMVDVVAVVRVVAVFVSPSSLAVLHLVVRSGPRHLCVLVVWSWSPLEARLHT